MSSSKGFLRGFGIGLILATVVLTLFQTKQVQVMSEEEIINYAKELGMMTQKEYLEQSRVEQLTEEEIIKQAQALGMIFSSSEEEQQEEAVEDVAIEEEVVTFSVEYGMKSEAVSRLLYDLGVLESEATLNNYLAKNNLTKYIQIGTYTIKKNETLETIAALICGQTSD